MRKLVGVVLVLAVVWTLVGSAAARSGSRNRTKPYNVMTLDADGARGTLGEVTFATREGERWVRIAVVDATGQKVAFDVDQGEDKSTDIDGCGRSKAIPIVGGRPVTVSILVNVSEDPDCPTSTGTQGTVRAQFAARES